MDNLITVITFTLPHEAHFAKAKLQSQGVEVFIKDEMTAHVNNFYSNAIGGVKLQVRSADVDAAYSILVDSGYIIEHAHEPNNMLVKFDKLTCRWPLIGSLAVELRMVITAALIVSAVVVTIVLVALP